MNVVIVNEGVPYPLTAGNRIRTLNLMLGLAQRHQITYLCRAGESPAETQLAHDYLKDHGITMIVADAAPAAKRGAAFYGRLAANLFSPRPYAVASHNSAAMRKAIRSLAGQSKVDLWQFEWLAYVDALDGFSSARTLVMAHNIESLIWQRYVEHEQNAARRFYLRLQWWKFRRYERSMLSKASGVVCVSEEDARLAAGEFASRRVWVVDNGIDRSYFQQVCPVPQKRSILFLGSLDWRPNLDAVKLLLDQAFPQVLRQEPEARLWIVGRRAPRWLEERVAATPAAQLFPDVADVRPYLSAATVMAVPLRVGGGSRLKILEALACGLPVVSTPVGCEGLALEPGRHLILSSDMQDLAAKLVWAIRNPAVARQMAGSGRQLVYERYDWDVLAKRLESAWTEVVQRQPAAGVEQALSGASSPQPVPG